MNATAKKPSATKVHEIRLDSDTDEPFAEYICGVKKLRKKLSDSTRETIWFRGHSDVDRVLVPGIFWILIRQNIQSKLSEGKIRRLRTAEVEANIRFLERAKAIEKNFPSDDDQVGQLVLARHHGLLSRLLDWSTSYLTALFFAVQDSEQDACVWMLDPYALNEKQWGESSIPYSHAQKTKEMARNAFNRHAHLDELKDQIAKEVSRPIQAEALAFYPRHAILRHMVQRAVFTIHHTPKALNDLPDAHDFLGKIIIPADKRRELWADLHRAGISRDLLFLDLDSMCKQINDITEHNMTLPYSEP